MSTPETQPDSANSFRPARVILAVQGGLGNQLFQWAFATALREEGAKVIIDSTRCRSGRPFVIEPLVAGWPQMWRHPGLMLAASTRTRQRLNWPVRLLRETSFGYDANLVAGLLQGGERRQPAPRSRRGWCSSVPAYLVGYYQSPRYFAGVEDQVTAAALGFVRSFLTPAGLVRYEELASSEDSVAIHVRRGDYVSVPSAAATHGALASEYYQRAREHLRTLGLTRVNWFSDDLAWVARKLAEAGDTVQDATELTTTDAGEIALMSACRVRVVANSSFSWWAGYLGRPSTADRPVIVPTSWFRDLRPTGDLIPRAWVRL